MSMLVKYESRLIIRTGAEISIRFKDTFMEVEGEGLIVAHIDEDEYPTPVGYHEVRIRKIEKQS